MGIRLIATDLDRTLFGRSGSISQYTMETLAECRERGIAVAYATARPARAAYPLHPVYRPDYILANNGATLCGGAGEILNERVIPREMLEELLPELINHKKIHGITMEAGDCLYTNVKDWSGWADVDWWKPIYHSFATLPNGQYAKISVECEESEILRGMTASYPLLHQYGNTGESWHQITHRDTSKINGIKLLIGRLGVSLSETAAFGDDQNDIQMLSACGAGVAVANAIPAARRAAKYICPSADQDGVALWIRRNIL